jgi:hypothetical protein
MVTMFTAKTLTSVPKLITRSAMNEPRMANAPTASGNDAAATLPKTIVRSTSSTGIDSISARPIDSLTRELMSAKTPFCPPTCTV